MEAWLLRLVPNLSQEWQGATPEQLRQLETLAGRPLPGFYRWFLERMGTRMGQLANPIRDHSAATVIAAYRNGLVLTHAGHLLIAIESEPIMPMHVFYDLDRPARNDARIELRHARGGVVGDRFETFREMLAWETLLRFRVDASRQRCEGSLTYEGGSVFPQLSSGLERMGFRQPVETGPCCGVFEREDAALACMIAPHDEPVGTLFFDFGADSVETIRKVLGHLAQDSSLRVEIDSWDPEIRA